MARLTPRQHNQADRPSDRTVNRRESKMLDVLMLALGAASFALLALYLVACERG